MVGAISHTRKDYETLLDISRLYYSLMSRSRVYPQDITQDIPLTSGANPNQFGSWTNVRARAPHLPPGTSVWGRVKSSLGGNTVNISVKLTRSVCPSKLDKIAKWPAFPW